jgi:hypothetical protein
MSCIQRYMCNFICVQKRKISKYPYTTPLNFFCFWGYFDYFTIYENIEWTKIPPNKSIMTYELCENTKIPLIQRHLFFDGKDKIVTTL